ncbi:hypothetical protein COLO4_12426 [Corchorus olitorius]|uniref:peptidylprolyl isomerase n=1 Tax=Corchorus olitorius TaxID=93759 RepID=A0A1R3K0W6_9ROSI|nr:hypothetical protein COLO4_12426 [Corchorus olitorius]
MYIEELKEGEQQVLDQSQLCGENLVVWDAKRVLVGAGARALFYPTLLYNVVRNKIQSEFRWWDRVDQSHSQFDVHLPLMGCASMSLESYCLDFEFILLGAVPFPTDVPRLKGLGVSGVVTLNEPYETLVPTSLYYVSMLLLGYVVGVYTDSVDMAHNIDHLVIPTRDYLFAPSFADICLAVDFIHENASLGKTTYVHCKAGRGRSTTIVLCYLVEHRHMTPDAAYEYVRSIRPRVLLASAQRQAVEDYYLHKVKNNGTPGMSCCTIVRKPLALPATQDTAAFDDGSVVVVTESDLDGYDASFDAVVSTKDMLGEGSLAGKFQFASQAAISRLSCLWLRCHADQKSSQKPGPLSSLGIDIRAATEDNIRATAKLQPGKEVMPMILSTPLLSYSRVGVFSTERKKNAFYCLSQGLKDNGNVLQQQENSRRRFLLFVLVSSGLSPTLPSSGKTKTKNPYDERRLLEQNKRRQKENNAPEDFPNFIREGFEVKVVTSDDYIKSESGLIYRDYEVGKGECPKAGQQVTFHYIGYNESGRRIDSTYLQGSPARIRMGTNAVVPGFEEGIINMKPGGKRRIIIPPELGPPVKLEMN